MRIVNRCHDRWANLHPAWKFFAVVAVIASFSFAVMRPGLGIYRDWRDGQRMESASKAIGEGRYSEARDLALAVLRRDGTRKETIPILLRSTEALNDPRRAEVALALLSDAEASREDRVVAWRVCCESSGTWLLQAIWSQLPEAERSDPVFISHLIDRLLFDGQYSDAELLLGKLAPPLAAALEERLMRLLVIKGTQDSYGEFQLRLGKRLADLPEDSLLVPLLDEVPQSALLPGLHAWLHVWHEKTGQLSPDAELRLARCEMAAKPDHAQRIFSDHHDRYNEIAPLITARWCLQIRRLREADEILARLPTGSGSDPEAFLLHCLVLEGLADHERWKALLAAAPAAVPAAWVACEVSFLADQQQDTPARNTASNLALQAAIKDPDYDALVRLARQAEVRALQALSRSAWIEAIRRRVGPLPMLSSIQSLIESLADDQKETELFDVLTSYRLLERGNPAIIAQHDYLACLNGRLSPEALIANLTPIYDQHPEALPLSCILALGHLLVDQPAQAMELTDGEIDWFSCGLAYRAIRGLALQAGGRGDEAAVYFENFPWKELLPSERKTLQAMAAAQGTD